MTSKKFKDDFRKKLKSVENIMIEQMFEDYVLYKDGKRIGTLYNNKVLLVATDDLKKIIPNAPFENSFDWGFYKLVIIEEDENIELLTKAIKTTYHSLYFQSERVADISTLIESYSSYSDIMISTYNIHITFLNFCYEKRLLKHRPIDKENRIIRMNFSNRDLTDLGTVFFAELYEKWLIYNDKVDKNSEKRASNTAILEKYYATIESSLNKE